MYRITNLTASPYSVHTPTGVVVLAAHGVIETDVAESYLPHLLTFPAVSVERLGDSAASLRDRYMAVAGKPADKHWSDKRLAEEIAKLETSND